MRTHIFLGVTLVILSALVFGLISCATILSGSQQKVNVESDPPGAKVYLNDKYTHRKTPCRLYVKRKGHNNDKEHEYLLKKEGFADYTYKDDATMNPWVLGNLVWGGLIGIGIDWLSGSIYKYDKEVSAILNPESDYARKTPEPAAEKQPAVREKKVKKTPQPTRSVAAETELVSDVDKNIPEIQKSYTYRFALIIGNEDYSSYQLSLASEVDVEFAINDAKAFKLYAGKTLGIPERNIVFLTNATTGQMHQAISKMNLLAKNSYGKAEIIFYYAGHGLPDEETQEPYLMPVDVSGKSVKSGIKLKDIYNKFTQHESKRITVFLDACFSGGARNQGLVASRGVKIEPKNTGLKGNLVVFSASSGIQSALPYREKKHGFFTYYLLKKFQQTGGQMTYSELSDYLKEKVGLESVLLNDKEQNPQVNLSSSVKDEWRTWNFVE